MSQSLKFIVAVIPVFLLFAGCEKVDDDLLDPTDAGKWTLYNTSTGLPGNKVSAIATDQKGVLWVAFPGKGVASYKNDQWNVYDTSNSGLLSNHVTCLAPTDDGGMLVGTDVGLSIKSKQDRWSSIAVLDALSLYINTIKVTSNGEIWLGTQNSGFFIVRKNGYIDVGLFQNFESAHAIEEDRKGNIWIGTQNGLLRYKSNVLTPYTVEGNGLPSNHINSLYCDSQGRLWIGTFRGKTFAWFDALEHLHQLDFVDLLGTYVQDIVEDKSGNIWFATVHKGLIMYDNVIPHQNMAEYAGFYDNDVNAICVDKDGHLWFGLNRKGLAKYSLPLK